MFRTRSLKSSIVDSNDLKAFLDQKVWQYNQPLFIETDPISIPHRYALKEDQEIAGFLAATISWGQRAQIVKTAHRLLDKMGDSPYDFVMNHTTPDLKTFKGFVYRTFQEEDLHYFLKALRHIYQHHGGLEAVFAKYAEKDSLHQAIHQFRTHFFELKHPTRTLKHVSDPLQGSASKRINMFLRWMVRRDLAGVDLGIWKILKPHQLSCPLDVHSGNVARKLGVLIRKQNDFKAVQELDHHLRLLDPKDPVKYDFALFGLGVFEGF